MKLEVPLIRSFCDSGGSCSTWRAETVSLRTDAVFRPPRGTLVMLRAVCWYSSHRLLGICVHIRADWTTSNSLSVSAAAMASQMSGVAWARIVPFHVAHCSCWAHRLHWYLRALPCGLDCVHVLLCLYGRLCQQRRWFLRRLGSVWFTRDFMGLWCKVLAHEGRGSSVKVFMS